MLCPLLPHHRCELDELDSKLPRRIDLLVEPIRNRIVSLIKFNNSFPTSWQPISYINWSQQGNPSSDCEGFLDGQPTVAASVRSPRNVMHTQDGPDLVATAG